MVNIPNTTWYNRQYEVKVLDSPAVRCIGCYWHSLQGCRAETSLAKKAWPGDPVHQFAPPRIGYPPKKKASRWSSNIASTYIIHTYHTHTHMYINIYIYTHVYIYIYITHTYTYVYLYIYTCIYIYTHHRHIHMYIYIYTHVYIYIHITHIYICIYLYIQMYNFKSYRCM